MALIVLVSGFAPKSVSSSNQPTNQTRNRTVAQLAASEYFHEDVSFDEVIVTIDDDYIFKTGTTETVISRNNRTETIIYEVKPGESIASVATGFGITPDTIRYANKISGDLRAGQKIKVPPIDGTFIAVSRNDTLSGIAGKYKVGVDQIAKYNQIDANAPIHAGQELLIPGVVAPKPAASTPTRGGGSTIAPAPSGVAGSIPASVGQFAWPLSSPTHFISQGYRGGHTGLDLNKLNGLGIYASADGVVRHYQTRGGYGRYIDMDHGGGWMTRYAHLSAYKVANGARVKKGDLIGIMGTTGRSTGVHLHFEIRLNGRHVNPLAYLPR